MIGNQAARQPHHFNIASGLTLEPPARLNPIEIAVDVELQQNRWMIRGAPRRLRIDPLDPEPREIRFINEGLDHANRIVRVDSPIQAFRKQRRLPAIHPLNKTLHPIPRESPGNHIYEAGVFHTARVRAGHLRKFIMRPRAGSGMSRRPIAPDMTACGGPSDETL